MMVSVEIAREVFKKINHIREEYRAKVLGGDANVISIEDLQWIIEGMYDFKIKKRQVPFEGDFIRGMVERWRDLLLVTVRQGQSLDWMRFTATKEMCHGVIDEKEDWSTAGVTTLEDVLVEYRLVEGEVAARPAQSEIFAELAAIELLYPYECRITDLIKLEKGETTMIKIANYHTLPVAIIARALAPGHHEFAERWWSELNDAAAAAE